MGSLSGTSCPILLILSVEVAGMFCSSCSPVCVFSLIGDKNSILQLREEHGVVYKRSFPGCQFIDWLLQNGEAESRRQGLELCRALQEHGIIQHGVWRQEWTTSWVFDSLHQIRSQTLPETSH